MAQINIKELEEAVDIFVSTLDDEVKDEYYCTDRAMAKSALNGFLEYMRPSHSAAEVASLKARIAALEKIIEGDPCL